MLLISDILVTNHEMSEAVAMCEKALKFRAERYGQEPNLQVARCLEKLGACRIHAKDSKYAAQNLRDALKIRQVLSNSKKDQDYYMCVLQLSGALKAAGYRYARCRNSLTLQVFCPQSTLLNLMQVRSSAASQRVGRALERGAWR